MEKKEITIHDVMEWHEHLSDVVANLLCKGDAVKEHLMRIYGNCLVGFGEINGKDNAEYEVLVSPLEKAPNLIKFKIRENGSSLSLSNEVAVLDREGRPVYFTLHLNEEYGYRKGRYTQMRTLPESARDANVKIQVIREGIEKARTKKREVEEKVGGLAISLGLMGDVLREDDDLHINGTKVDAACDLIDFYIENLTMTLNRRYRMHADEPYWEVSSNVVIYYEENGGERYTIVDIDKV